MRVNPVLHPWDDNHCRGAQLPSPDGPRELNDADVKRGLSFDNIKLPAWLPPVDHLDLVRKGEGGWGGLGPSVAIRVWFVGTDVLDKIQF